MKKLFILLAVGVFLTNCKLPKSDIAREQIRLYYEKNLHDIESYENVSYSELRPTMMKDVNPEILANNMVDSIDLAVLKDVLLIHENSDNRKEYDFIYERYKRDSIIISKAPMKQIGYEMDDVFRAKNKLGAVNIATYTFVFDTLLNITHVDID